METIPAVPDWLTTAIPVVGGLCFGALLLLILSLTVWTARDIAARSRDIVIRAAAVLLVLLVPGVGIAVYLLLRPRETISERYERELIEELLAREISQQALVRRQTRSSGSDASGGQSSGAATSE